MMKKPIVIYHSNCADGFAAAWCFHKKYGDGVDFHAGVYQDAPPDIEDRDVYLVDFSYKSDVIRRDILPYCKSLTILDHHKSAIEDLDPMIGTAKFDARFDLERSGAMIAWDYLFPGEKPPRMLEHVQDRDLWRFKLRHTREIQSNLFSYPYTFELYDGFMALEGLDLVEFASQGAALERKHHKDIAELLTQVKRRMIISGYNVPVASLPYTLSSDAGNVMAKDEAFAACYWDTAEHRVFSLRSVEDGVDVSVIAAQYGGGGHAHAAGFRVSRHHDLAKA